MGPEETMYGVTEYCEGFLVTLTEYKGRLVVHATNEGGYSSTKIDVVELLYWFKTHKPELLK